LGLNARAGSSPAIGILKDLIKPLAKLIMNDTTPLSAFLSPWRVTASVLLCLSFAITLLAAVKEPGSEADGVYSCGKGDKQGKYVELGKLELKGRNYRTWSTKDTLPPEKREFHSFKADGKGRIEWSTAFGFLGSSTHMAGGTSEYYLDEKGNPSILINYSENHSQTSMICTKEK
jgi:hypothetical protein